ncbi:MAG: PAS domain S-box protein [Leptolyngbya sp. DLM2.Bin27]|nr:MAG: PAS domain S-box protein [Leptolyngbya sp. DLM2.Bin27]
MSRPRRSHPLQVIHVSLPWVLTVPLGIFTLGATVLVGSLYYSLSYQGDHHDGTRQILLLVLVFLGGAMIQGLVLTQGLLVRLRLFNQVSGELAAGNLAQRLPTNSRISELNHLAASLNQMADTLQRSFRQRQITLVESETKFTTIFRTSPEPMALATLAEGRLIDVNHSLLEFFGYQRDEMLGYTAVELNLWVDLRQRDRYLALLAQQGRVRNLEIQVATKRGEIKTVLLSAEVQTLDGQDCLIVTHRDVTDRKRAELALQDSEARFRQLAETVEEGFFVYDTEAASYTYVNPSYATILGLTAQTFDGMAHWLDNIHADDRDRIIAALGREQQGDNFDQEYRYLTPSGELRWLRSKAFPLCNEAGAVVRVVGTVENITRRKDTEAALRQSQERFRHAFDHAPYGIALVSTTGQFVQANAYYCHLLGYSEAELRTLTFQDITHPDDRADDWARFQRLIAGETPTYEAQKRYLTKQNQIVPAIVNSALIYDEAGQPLYSVGHVRDRRDRLAIDRIKNEFISVVSHELRTPITSIQGALALLGAGVYADRPEQTQRLLAIAINNSDRLVRLVDDILSFERLESGRVQLEKELCSVAQLMYQAVDSVQPMAEKSGITIVTTPLDTTLWAAPDAIIQVLTNLLSNAIKFACPQGTVWLKASREGADEGAEEGAEEGASPSLLFTVRDQGRGIPPDKLDLVFERFQQVDVSDSRRRGGTGLGLAICKRIVQQHQGHIWVESTVSVGSTFYVALPLSPGVNHA